MFRDEHQFTNQVVHALEVVGFGVKREVRVPGRWRRDIVATKDDVRIGIEVKFTPRGLLDEIVKAQRILRIPQFDEMYVCGPKVFMSEDVRALASNLKVGLLAVTDAGELVWVAKSPTLEAARLTVGGGYAKPRGKRPFDAVRPGGSVVFNAAVFNSGQKTAVNVEVFMVAAGPFVARRRSKSRARKPFLEGGPVAWQVRLECHLREGTPPGKYPLMISATADNAARDDDSVPFEVWPS